MSRLHKAQDVPFVLPDVWGFVSQVPVHRSQEVAEEQTSVHPVSWNRRPCKIVYVG